MSNPNSNSVLSRPPNFGSGEKGEEANHMHILARFGNPAYILPYDQFTE